MRAFLALAALLATVACAPPRPSEPEPAAPAAPAGQAAAPGERTKVVVYSPHGREMLEPFEQRFEAAHPEIDFEWLDLGSQAILNRLRAEKANPGADLWWGAPHTMFAQAADDELLAPYQPSWSEAVDESRRDPEHRWYGQYLTPGVIVYNSRLVTADKAPADWDDLLKPEWKGKILIRDPLDSGTMRTFLQAMIQRQADEEAGLAWLLKLDANTKEYPAEPALLWDALNKGQGLITVWNLRDVEIQKKTHGYEVAYVIPTSGCPVVTDGIALVAGGPNPAAAKVVYEYVTALEQLYWAAEQFFCLPARTDVDPDQLPAAMPRDLPELALDWARVASDGDRQVETWDGAVRGQGGG